MYILALLPTWTGSTWCWQKPKSWNAIAKAAYIQGQICNSNQQTVW
jgi:hypothetical protein